LELKLEKNAPPSVIFFYSLFGEVHDKKKRICIVTLNKTARIKSLLEMVGFSSLIAGVFGSDVPPYGATKGQRIQQLQAPGMRAVLFDDSDRNLKATAASGVACVRAAPLTPSMLLRCG